MTQTTSETANRVSDGFESGFMERDWESQIKNCDDYFLTPLFLELLSAHQPVLEAGCGSGRWATLVAPRVGHLSLVDPSDEALNVARQNLSDAANTSFHRASVDALPFDHRQNRHAVRQCGAQRQWRPGGGVG